jgi:hypothetical protein
MTKIENFIFGLEFPSFYSSNCTDDRRFSWLSERRRGRGDGETEKNKTKKKHGRARAAVAKKKMTFFFFSS